MVHLRPDRALTLTSLPAKEVGSLVISDLLSNYLSRWLDSWHSAAILWGLKSLPEKIYLDACSHLAGAMQSTQFHLAAGQRDEV